MMRNRVSFTTMSTPDWSGTQAIRAARQLGYQGVDLRVSDVKGELTLESSSKKLSRLRQMAKDEGVAFPSVLCYNAVAEVKGAGWDTMRESILRHVDLAEKIGAESIRIFCGPVNGMTDPAGYLDRTNELLSGLMSVCEQAGVRILLQNHANWANAQNCFRLVENVNHPFLVMGFSPEHAFRGKESVSKPLRHSAPSVFTFYIADYQHKEAEDDYLDMLPGDGDIPLADYLASLEANSPYRGWMTFKYERIWNPNLLDPEESLPRGLVYIRNLVGSKPV